MDFSPRGHAVSEILTGLQAYGAGSAMILIDVNKCGPRRNAFIGVLAVGLDVRKHDSML